MHSRAARRATSPGIDLDKSLKDLRPPTLSSTSAPSDPVADNTRPAVLRLHHSAGVHKPSSPALTRRKAANLMSARARKRRERDVDMALAVAERTEKKVEGSWGKAKSVAARRKNWEVINDKVGGDVSIGVGKEKGIGKFSVLAVEGDESEDEMLEDSEKENLDRDGDEDMGAGLVAAQPIEDEVL